MRTRKENFFLILLLGTLTALGPFSIDMYLPSFNQIAEDLNTTVNQVSLSLSSFFIGISVGQLFYGPVLDRFGRKKPLYFGLALYCAATVGCILVQSVDGLIWLRFIQALGSCAAAVASVAMVRDFFPARDTAKVFALLMLVVGVSPMIAPTVGGYVTAAFGWHAVFTALLIITLLIFAAVLFWLPEGHPADATISLKPVPILKGYWEVLKNPTFLTYALTGAVAFSGLFAYVAGSSFVFMNVYQVDAKVYGWIFAFLSIAFIGTSQLNTLALRYASSERIVRTALISQAIVGLIMWILVANGALSLYGMIAMLFAFFCCTGFLGPNTSALALVPFEKNAGSASAMLGALQMSVGAVFTISLGLIEAKTALPMVSLMEVAAIFGAFVLIFGQRKLRKSSL